MGNTIPCSFQHNAGVYSCHVSNTSIPLINDIKLDGKHVDKLRDRDVTTVWFNNCTLSKIPKGLTKQFPKLKNLIINNSKIKDITKNDLTEYKKLKKLDLSGQEIEFLPNDLFEGFENLEHINFSRNKLKLIEPKVFDGLNNLKFVNLEYNPYYFLTFSTDSNNPFSTNLEDFKKKLIIKYPTSLMMTKEEVETREFKDIPFEEVLQHEAVKVSESMLIANLKTFLENDKTFKDFTITIADRHFMVHKAIITARSPLLAEILRNNPDADTLKLVDIPMDIFEKILKFIYTAELPQDEGTNFMQLFAAAGKLKIEDLKNFAASKLRYEINTENALDIIKLSNKYDHNGLRQHVFDIITKLHPEIIFKTEWASDADKLKEVMRLIKKKDELIYKLETEYENMMN